MSGQKGAMDGLVPIINDLMDIFNGLGFSPIQLPMICTVGGQSAGKSSVLEAVVRKDFLPRGSGIVTRRPLLLQLVNPHTTEWEETFDDETGDVVWMNKNTGEVRKSAPPKSAGKVEEYGEFLHLPDQKFTDFEAIRAEIERFTEETCPNQTVKSDPISLKIVSPDVLTMTLVDLPGLTRNPVGGQPESIMMDIRAMVEEYVKDENAIILAVSPANQDLANSDALAMARKHDPKGQRTIGVLTKLDLMDEGTDASKMLKGEEYPLKLGYIGVVNRSQKAINDGLPMSDAFRAERSYFENHPAYMHMSNKMGTAFLSHQINRVLTNHIRASLPTIRTKILTMAAQKEDELEMLGGDEACDPAVKQSMIMGILHKVSQEFGDMITGESEAFSDAAVSGSISGGARLRFIFKNIFQDELELQRIPDNKQMSEDIKFILMNVQGTKPGFFIPDRCFEVMVKRQVDRYKQPVFNCCQLAHDELNRIMMELPCEELSRFHVLRERVTQVMAGLLRECLDETKKVAANLLNMECAYINTDHPEFQAGSGYAALYGNAQSIHDVDDYIPPEQQAYREANLTAVFKHLDKNDDGKVDLEEVKMWGKELRNRIYTPEEAQKILKSFDVNDDNEITHDEWMQYHENVIPGNYTVQQFEESLTNYLPKKTLNKVLGRLPPELKVEAERSERDKTQSMLIRRLLQDYNDIVLKNIKDTIPKAIMYKMVNVAKDKMHMHMMKELYKQELFEELLEEDPELEAQRRRCRQMVIVLNKAVDVLNKVGERTVT
jgi:dynamin 1-like protein